MTALPPSVRPIRFRTRSVTAIWLRHAIALARVWRVATTWFLVEPAFILLAAGLGIGHLVGEAAGNVHYAEFVAPGIVMGQAMFHAIFESSWSAFQRIQQSVFETILTAPVTVAELTLAEMLWATTRASISTVAVGGLAVALGWMPLSAAPGVLVAGALVGLVFSAIGLFFAALSPTLHALSLVFTLVATPLFFMSGAFFPIEILPDLLEPVAWAAPLTPGVHLARGFAQGALGAGEAAAALYLVALAVGLYPVAVALLRRRLVR